MPRLRGMPGTQLKFLGVGSRVYHRSLNDVPGGFTYWGGAIFLTQSEMGRCVTDLGRGGVRPYELSATPGWAMRVRAQKVCHIHEGGREFKLKQGSIETCRCLGYKYLSI